MHIQFIPRAEKLAVSNNFNRIFFSVRYDLYTQIANNK